MENNNNNNSGDCDDVGMGEPPTPSVESNAESVFENSGAGQGDVEMDDAGSFTSAEEEEDYRDEKEGRGAIGFGLYRGKDQDGADVEMDESTPTMTARPVEGLGGRGWVPWGC